MLYRLIMCIAMIGLVQHEAAAADIDTPYLRGSDGYEVAPVPPAWLWTGFYGGVHVGAVAGIANFTDPFGSSIFGDNVTTPGFLAGGQIGYNWEAPNSPWVFGLEADLSWLGV